MNKTLEALKEQGKEINLSTQDTDAQEVKARQSREHVAELVKEYGTNPTYLQEKEIEEARRIADEQDVVYRDMRMREYDAQTHFKIDTLKKELEQWGIEEIASDKNIAKKEEELYKNFAKALDSYHEYQELIKQRADGVYDEIKDPDLKKAVNQLLKRRLIKNPVLPFIHPEKEEVLQIEHWPQSLYFTKKTWNEITQRRKGNSEFKKASKWMPLSHLLSKKADKQ